MTIDLKGSMVAIVSPMLKGGQLDLQAFNQLVEWHISEGTSAIVVVGTTGESATLSMEEHCDLVSHCVGAVNKRIPIIAGTGSNSTEEALYFTTSAKECGADACLLVAPYYNKPTQEGLYQHYKKINDNVGIPIIIYNIPPRSVIDMSVDTMARLFELKNIAGVKDATANLNRVDQQLKKMGPEFIQLSGEDGTALDFNMRGGVGCISVTANVAAKLCSEFQDACLYKKNETAKEINKKLMPLHKALFIESNPSPVKYAAKLLGLCDDYVRLPLVKITDQTKLKVKNSLISAKLLNE